MGCGGLALVAVTVAKALGIKNVVACDIDAAAQGGASGTGNLKASNTQDKLREITNGGPRAVVDTVGAETTSSFGIASLVKGGAMSLSAYLAASLGCRCPSCHCVRYRSSALILEICWN